MTIRVRKRMLPVGAIVLLGLTGFAIARIGTSQLVSAQDPQDATVVSKAVRDGGLRAAAKLKKRYVGSVNTSGWVKYDLEGLTHNSSGIVIGVPMSSVSQLSGDGELVTTEYKIRVQEILKGALVQDQIINVTLPGGILVFEDGTSAEIQTPDLLPMKKGKVYVLFLRIIKNSSDNFSLTGGGQGLFELGSGSVVTPHGHRVDLVQKYKNQRTADFLGEIKSAVIKYPDVLSCCN